MTTKKLRFTLNDHLRSLYMAVVGLRFYCSLGHSVLCFLLQFTATVHVAKKPCSFNFVAGNVAILLVSLKSGT